MKVTMNVNDVLLERVDRYAKQNYLTRTSVFSYAVSQFLMAQELPSLLGNLNNVMVKMAESGTITEEQQKTLEDIQALVRLMNSD